MYQITRSTRISTASVVKAALFLTVLILPALPARAQQTSKKGWGVFLQNLSAALAGQSSIVGQWRGSKGENDPVHGGSLNLEFVFSFGGDGTYKEAAYMGSRQVMYAEGTYQVSPASTRDDPSFTNMLTFHPGKCDFSSDALAESVKFFPIPNERDASMFIGLSSGDTYMTLKDASLGRMGESWGLRASR